MFKYHRSLLCGLFIVLFSFGMLKAQNLNKGIDSLILKEFSDQNGPCAVFMVAHGGKTIYEKTFGKANLEVGNDLKVENVFELGLMTKQFTEMMVDFFKDELVDFAPGEKFEYNNSGYVILGYLIELVSGESYEQFIQKHIFEKLHMDNSRYAIDRLVHT